MIDKNAVLNAVARPVSQDDAAYALLAEDAMDKAVTQMRGKTGFQLNELPDTGHAHLTRDEQFRYIIREIDLEIDELNATLGQDKTCFTPCELEIAQRAKAVTPKVYDNLTKWPKLKAA